MTPRPLILALLLGGALLAPAATPNDEAAYLQQFPLDPAPRPARRLVQPGDRLALCGDSITEQKMYSRLIEDYLTMCVPELGVTVRQYGWGGEKADGFLRRMTNDVLRFQPTLATTCYGMNDHGYKPYEPEIGRAYYQNMAAIARAFQAHQVRLILGSPGCVGPALPWGFVKGTSVQKNQNLAALRNLGLEIATETRAGFADVFSPMLKADFAGRRQFGTNYLVAGTDGVHPSWAGQAIMAYAFLKAMGLDGDLGTFTVDLKSGRATATAGHQVLSAAPGEVRLQSSRYPFCPCFSPATLAALPGENYPACGLDNELARSDTLRSAFALIPFHQDLNRLRLVVKNASAKSYQVTWGTETRSFPAAALKKGVNLAEAFPANPFSDAFARVDAAVLAKQSYETVQIKQKFHGDDGKKDMEGTVARTEAQRAPLAAAIKAAFVPVTHTLRIQAE